jgi:hypothetical protein
MIGMIGGPMNGFWMTNITFVYTNTAVRTPTIDLGQVTIYGTNAFSKATVIAWDPPTNGVVAGYKVFYGLVSGGTTNVFTVNSNITSVAFYSSLATNVQWWAYATAFDKNTNQSLPSNQVLFTPTK